MTPAPPDIDTAVVGAGVSGLATARALDRAGRDVRVFEAADAVGGRMRTLHSDGWRIDTGAEMLPSAGYPATWALIRELGMAPADVPRVPRALALWRGGRARPHAGRPLGLVTGAGLSPRARAELMRLQLGGGEAGGPADAATLEEFAAACSPELRERFLYPLAAGFFGWRPDRSAAAPLLTHLRATGSTARWRTYRGGMDALARRLAAGLHVSTGTAVHGVAAVPGGARLTLDGGTVTARSAVLAVPAPAAVHLHPGAPDDEHAFLAACSFAPMLRVSLELERRPDAAGGMRGFATLIPAAEDDVLNVVTLDHNKHPDRAPAGRGLVSLVAAPPATAALTGADDTETAAALVGRAERYLPGLGGLVRRTRVHRFSHGLPEATPAALRARRAFHGRPARAVDYAGDWTLLRPCSEGAVASAEVAVARILAHVADHPSPAHRAPPGRTL
ncbi:protoporphyrinogen/coproporphyrinogen oxidase [Streptomonospora salina]|uniref:Oxygen-dependent protoporphyrinogen oxidase n=1 Tax=Streptomonospora salina TaxID=104205 RepID=A0A841EEJ9_9ACTN|nr:FAD-dependent oxidoreductase [Streptomonospora salina]MBB5999759.1 oxygen-dependent protoporphyrinogen oxidase [Streptomonospora salina]